MAIPTTTASDDLQFTAPELLLPALSLNASSSFAFPDGDDAVAEEILSRLDYRSAARAAAACRLFKRAFQNPKVQR